MQTVFPSTPSLKHSNPYTVAPLIEQDHLSLLKRSNSQSGTDLLGYRNILLDVNDDFAGHNNVYFPLHEEQGGFFSQRGALLDDHVHPPSFLPFAQLAAAARPPFYRGFGGGEEQQQQYPEGDGGFQQPYYPGQYRAWKQ